MMNFVKGNKGPDLRAIDRELAGEVRAQNQGETHLRYAPPNVREASAKMPVEGDIPHVETFEELPTKEIDDLIRKAEDKVAQLKKDGDAIKGMFKKHVERVRAEYEALNEGIDMSVEMFDVLHKKIAAIGVSKKEKEE